MRSRISISSVRLDILDIFYESVPKFMSFVFSQRPNPTLTLKPTLTLDSALTLNFTLTLDRTLTLNKNPKH